MSIAVQGFSASTKTPGARLAVIFGGPGTSAGVAPKKILCFGAKIATTITGSLPTISIPAGTAVLETPVQVFSNADAQSQFGRGSELALMCAQIFKLYPSATLYGLPVTKAAGNQATVVLTPTVSGNTAVTIRVWVAGRMAECSVATSDTVVTIGAAIAAAFNALPGDSPATAQYDNSTGAVTFTSRCYGTRQNLLTIRAQLISGSTSAKMIGGTLAGTVNGVTLTLSGGAAIGSTYFFANGTGTDSLTTALAAVAGTKFDRYVVPNIDSTNLGLVVTQLNNMAGVNTQKRQQAVCASVDTYANAVTAATARNAPRLQMAWHYNSDATPGELAAALCAARLNGDGMLGGATIGEATDPAANLNGLQLGLPVQDATGEQPTDSQIENALNNGLTPLRPSSLNPGTVEAVASITSRSLDAQSLQNYSVFETKVVTVSDFVADDLQSDFGTQFAGYKLEADTSAPVKKPRVTQPKYVRNRIIYKLKDYELRAILTGVDSTLGQLAVQIDPANSARVLCEIPEIPIPNLSQIAGNVRQLTIGAF